MLLSILQKLCSVNKYQVYYDSMSRYTDQGYAVVNFVYFATLSAFINHDLHHTALTMKDQKYYDALMAGDFILPDGIALQLLRYRLKKAHKIHQHEKRLPNHNGTDFMPYFLETLRHEYGQRQRIRLVLYGSYKHIIPHTRHRLLEQGYEVIYSQDGYNVFDRQALSLALQDRTDQDIIILLVGRGSPLQEIRSHESINQIKQYKLLVFCVGGLLDFWGGAEQRAPKLIRWLKGEWLRRFILHPSKNLTKFVSSFRIFPVLFSKKLLKL
jgi:exopolysaccharide biosynthesis WecB/TagA/CpsF family protein